MWFSQHGNPVRMSVTAVTSKGEQVVYFAYVSKQL